MVRIVKLILLQFFGFSPTKLHILEIFHNNKLLGADEMKKRALVFGWAMILTSFLVFFNASRADASIPADAGIEGIEWLLTEVSGTPVSPLAGEKQPHILLDPAQKKVSGFAGCNSFFAGYTLDGATLKFGPAGSTRMACPDLETGLETEVFKALDQTRAWKIQDNVLLFLDDSAVLARFAMAREEGQATNSEPKITGTVWQWMHTQYSDDRKLAPAHPENYTVQFQENGTLSVKADCNQKGGTYSASMEEKTISIKITHSTMAACPEDSLEDEFVKNLSAAAIYFIKLGDLYIDLKYDSGTMFFQKNRNKK